MSSTRYATIASAVLIVLLVALNVIPFHRAELSSCAGGTGWTETRTTTYGFPVGYFEYDIKSDPCTDIATLSRGHNTHEFLIQAVFIDLLVGGSAYVLLNVGFEARRRKR